MDKPTQLKGIEQGRAEFAYKCAEQIITLKTFTGCSNQIIKIVYEKRFQDKLKNSNNREILNDFFNEPEALVKQSSQEQDESFQKKIYNYYTKQMKEYKSYAKKIPMLIKTNGLGTTFAFMMSKGGTYEIIGEQVLAWLKFDNKKLLPDANGIENFSELTQKVVELNSLEYRALTLEVLSFLNWLRRFADGLIEGEDNA